MTKQRFYLDICALNRPFDDHLNDRIRLEAEAVLSVLDAVRTGRIILIGSSILDFENNRNPDAERRMEIHNILALTRQYIVFGRDEISRAAELECKGIKPLDSAHVACAESARADVFLTTDDRLLNKSGKRGVCRIRVMNPLDAIRGDLI